MQPTPRPTRAPYKRPLRYTDIPTIDGSTNDPSETVFEKKTVEVIPPGCDSASDINLAVKEALVPQQEKIPTMHVLFPVQDTSLRGGTFSGK